MKIKSTKALVAILSITFALTSCSKIEIETALDQTNSTSIIDNGNRAARPVILGEKLNNPYSIKNMRAALDTLKAHSEQQSSSMKAPSTTLEDITIVPTDLYVRFLPADRTQFVKLMTDTSLIIFDYPLDYEKTQTGDYYKDPTVKGEYTWLYATVPTGYQPPIGIRYEIIEELFIPEHSLYYSQKETSSNIKSLQHLKSNVVTNANYTDILKNLEVTSFVLTGNSDKLNKPTTQNAPKGMQKSTTSTKKWGLFGAYYVVNFNPEGYIKVSTPYGDQPLANIRVRVARYFTAYETRTDANGRFYFSNQFGQDAIFPNIEYFVFFDGVNANNTWRLCDNIAGAAILWTTGISIGVHSPDNYSMTFNTSSYFWGESVQHKALNDYMNIARTDGISLPPASLEIATLVSDNYTSGTPLFKNTVSVTSVLAIYNNLYGILPDIMLRYSNELSKYQMITYIAWHELTHASQVQSMINNKGNDWASGYWSVNAGQQATNSVATGQPYGAKGDWNWQLIALSEGWANYREWVLSNKILNYNSLGYDNYGRPYYFYNYGFPVSYGEMYDNLQKIGCSYSNMEKSLTSYSISGYRDNLIQLYPSLNTQITSIIKSYE